MCSQQALSAPKADHRDLYAETGDCAQPAPAPISTDTLLAGQSAVTLEHQGVHYILRATRSGKLILTK